MADKLITDAAVIEQIRESLPLATTQAKGLQSPRGFFTKEDIVATDSADNYRTGSGVVRFAGTETPEGSGQGLLIWFGGNNGVCYQEFHNAWPILHYRRILWDYWSAWERF